MIDVDITYGGTRLAIGRHVGQLVVPREGLAIGSGSDAARDVELLGDDVAPDGIDGPDVGLVARKCRHVCHAGIHVGGADGVPHGFVLLHDGLVGLRILVFDGRLAAVVEEELGFVEVLPLARHEVKLRQSHLGNLVAGHDQCLSRTGAHLLANEVGIADGNVEELAAARCLIVGNGRLHHVPQVIQLVASLFLRAPTLRPGPVMGVFGVLRPGCIEVAVRLLGRCNHVQHRVDVGGKGLVGKGLQDVARALDGLVGVGIVEGEGALLYFEDARRALQMLRRIGEIRVAARLLALRESKGNGHFAARLQALPPERAGDNLDGSEGNGRDGIAIRRLRAGRQQAACERCNRGEK